MINVPINEAESIFEPFWDGGESYPNNEKFSRLTEYTVTYAKGAVADVTQIWCAVNVILQSQTTDGYAVKLERDCALDIRNYDIFRVFASIDKNIALRVRCVIDGQEQTIIERQGCGETDEIDGKISGQKITHYSLEFRLSGTNTAIASLNWMGLSNQALQATMEARKSSYNADWDGCFAENPEIRPMVGMYFSDSELEELRERLNKKPFSDMLDKLRAIAQDALLQEPEQYITDYIPCHDRRWVRNRDMKRPIFQEHITTLAFVGLIDRNLDMLRMACRIALSLAVTPYWTESIMGRFPGATWHHRCFTEEVLCRQCAMVLDWAGTLLTWHGKNILYHALMLKGLPQLESDFKSVDYIREMNQGIVFDSGRIPALLVLADRYPRYESWLADAEKDMREMIDTYILADGGTREGPGYWNYTFSNAIVSVYLLARHKHLTLEEYAWDKLRLTGDFALAMLSDEKDGSWMMPISDAHGSRYVPVLTSAFSRISRDPRWKKLYDRVITDTSGEGQPSLDTLILSSDPEPAEGDISQDGFSTLNTTGHTSLRRTTEDVGRIHFYISGGPNYFAHCHGDRGQIILEVNHIPMLIDRGICTYSNSNVAVLGKSYNHNLLQPEAPEGRMAYNQNSRAAGASVVRSTYENGCFDYCTDTSGAWQAGIFRSISRSVRSADPHLYVIYDDAEFVSSTAASFRLHTHGRIQQKDGYWTITAENSQITVTPVNYTPVRVEFGEDGVDGALNSVNSLKLYLDKAEELHLITLLEVSPVGKEKAVLSSDGILYNEKKISL